MDEDGYPTEETLERIRRWPYKQFEELIEFLKELWIYEDYIGQEEAGAWEVSTGGWSGHEDIIGALRQNAMWWMFYWQGSRRGGHYLFAPLNWKGSVRFYVEANADESR